MIRTFYKMSKMLKLMLKLIMMAIDPRPGAMKADDTWEVDPLQLNLLPLKCEVEFQKDNLP